MNEKYHEVDLKKWKRSMHHRVFRKYAIPQYCITVELDVTNFCSKVKENHWSFSFAFVFIVTKCANKTEEFRYRFLDGKVVQYKQINTAFTSMHWETELFKVVKTEMQDHLEDYIRLAAENAKNQTEYFVGPLGNEVYFFSSVPWLSYTQISDTFDGDTENAAPMFQWGKFYEKDGKKVMPFSVKVHHAFVDGLHVARLVESIQKYLNEL